MAGGRTLVAVTEPTSGFVYKTYRAQNDTSFMRYERMHPKAPVTYRWRVYSTDGTTYFFGDSINTLGCQISDGFAPLTRMVDAFGNEVVYEWEPASSFGSECRIKKISWGQNAAAGLTNPFAQVVFNWIRPPECGNIETGSQRSYRTGHLIVTGASKLVSITATAFPPGSRTAPEHTRAITLNYSAVAESCTTTHAPLRLLTSIQESAFGTDSPRVDLPAVNFEYGSATIDHVTPRPPLPGPPWFDLPPRRNNLGWGYRRTGARRPTVEAMMLDLNGDGLLDRVTNASTETAPGDGQCKALAAEPRSCRRHDPPRRHGDLHAAAAEVERHNHAKLSAGRRRDRRSRTPALRRLRAQRPVHGVPELGPVGAPPPPFSTYLVYRWLDMDADGLVDLVAAVHGTSAYTTSSRATASSRASRARSSPSCSVRGRRVHLRWTAARRSARAARRRHGRARPTARARSTDRCSMPAWPPRRSVAVS